MLTILMVVLCSGVGLSNPPRHVLHQEMASDEIAPSRLRATGTT